MRILAIVSRAAVIVGLFATSVVLLEGHASAQTSVRSSTTAAAMPASGAVTANRRLNSGALTAVSRLHFERNLGQEKSPVPFIGRSGARKLLIEPSRIQVFPFHPRTAAAQTPVQLEFVHANTRGVFEPLDELSTRANYFRGPKDQWRTGVPEFGRLRCRALYRNIDLVLHSDTAGNGLEYDFEVAPKSDVSAIAIRFSGVRNLHLERSGELVLDAPGGPLRQRLPVAYQDIYGTRVAVSARYELLAGNVAKIIVGNYRHDLPLTIDPALIYSTVLNGSAPGEMSYASASAVYADSTGHTYTYVGGYTNSGADGLPDFPIKNASDSQARAGFIAKLDTTQAGDASAIYVTYFDGVVSGMATDLIGNLYIAGLASLPVVNGYSADGTSSLVKFSSDGSTILYSTGAGGSTITGFSAVAVDGSGNAYVVGNTYSGDLPQVNPLRLYPVTGPHGYTNPFVQAINTNVQGAASLTYSTYVTTSNTGSQYVTAESVLTVIATDEAKRIYVAGKSNDTTFPVVNGFSSTVQGEGGSPLLAVLDPSNSGSSQMVYSTFIGGPDGYPASGRDDSGATTALMVDASGNVYAAGATAAHDLPTTPGAYQTYGSGGFIVKINPSLSGLISVVGATYFSGTAPRALALDASGNVFLAGSTGVVGFPLLNPIVPAATGLFQSLDRGDTWKIVNSIPLAGALPDSLAIDTSTLPRTFYVGTRGGVFKSVDGGLNWTAANNGLASTNVGLAPIDGIAQSSLLIDPQHPTTLFVATDAGVFKSSDGAQTWTLFSAGQPHTLALDGTLLYRGDDVGVFQTSTTGATANWAEVPNSGGVVASIAVDPTTHALYAGYWDSDSLWMTPDDGTTWNNLSRPNYPTWVAVDSSTYTSTTPSTIWSPGFWDETLFRTSDQGTTWVDAGLTVQIPRGFVFDRSTSPATVFVISDYVGGAPETGGLFRSSDYGQTWDAVLNASLGAIALDPTTSAGNPPVLYAFTDHANANAFVAELDSTLSTLKFSTVLGGAGGDTRANALSIDGSGNVYVVGGTQSSVFPLLNAYNSSVSNSAFLSVIGTPTLPASSSTPVTTTVGTATGSLNITMPDITGSTTTSAPTVSVTPLTNTDIANFSLSNNLGAYDISTTATFSGAVTLCVQALTVNDVATFNGLTLLHIVNGVPVNITSSYDFPSRTICGTTSSFSPFVLVKGVLGQLQDLVSYVNDSNLRHGIQSSLDAKLQNAESAFSSATSKDYSNVCNTTTSFINNVFAQTGQAITTAESQHMIASAKQVKATLGCK